MQLFLISLRTKKIPEMLKVNRKINVKKLLNICIIFLNVTFLLSSHSLRTQTDFYYDKNKKNVRFLDMFGGIQPVPLSKRIIFLDFTVLGR